MLWYTIAAAVLNIGLGFAVAVYLGRRHRALLARHSFSPAFRQWPVLGLSNTVTDFGQPEETYGTPADVQEAVADPGPPAAPAEVALTPPDDETSESGPPASAAGETPPVSEPLDGSPHETPPDTDLLGGARHQPPTETDVLGAGPHEAPPQAGMSGGPHESPPVSDVLGGGPRATVPESEVLGGGPHQAPPESAVLGVGPHEAPPESESDLAEAAPEVPPRAEPALAEDAGREPPEPEPDGEDEKLEAALAQWQDDVQRYFEGLSRVSDGLRDCQQAPEPEKLEGCLSDLRAANRDYLQSDEARQSLDALAGSREGLGDASEDLHAARRSHAALIADTDRAIESFDCEADLEDGCRRMIQRTNDLMEANGHVRDALEAASFEAKRRGDATGVADPAARHDGVTELPTAPALKAGLRQWWEQDPERTRHLGVATVDVDHFARVNELHGRSVGDRLLKAIGRLLKAEARGQGLTVRLAGNRFACLFYDGDLHFAVDAAEHVRQTIETAVFEHRGADIQVTVSCGVTEATAQDTPELLLTRVQATLEQAKRYGHNRSSYHDGTFPVPVNAPLTLTLDPRRIPL